MTKEEFLQVASILRSVYPQKGLPEDNTGLEIWYGFLKDLDSKTVKNVVQQWISTNHYPPAISDLRKMAVKIVNDPLPDEGEAWAQCRKALGNAWYGADEEWEKLHPAVRKAIGTKQVLRNWSVMENAQSVIEAQFRRSYRVVRDRFEHEEMIPEAVKANAEMLKSGVHAHPELTEKVQSLIVDMKMEGEEDDD